MFGFVDCIDLLVNYIVLCIDEFELDDLGNIMLIFWLFLVLVEWGVLVVVIFNILFE